MNKHLLLSVVVLGGMFVAAVNPAPAQTWTPTLAPVANWHSVASSADGSKLIAAVEAGGVYLSSDSGTT
jgi:hypothetical protein